MSSSDCDTDCLANETVKRVFMTQEGSHFFDTGAYRPVSRMSCVTSEVRVASLQSTTGTHFDKIHVDNNICNNQNLDQLHSQVFVVLIRGLSSSWKLWFCLERIKHYTRRVWVFADIPHILKLLCNHIVYKSIVLPKFSELLMDIIKLIVNTNTGEVRLVPKVTLLAVKGNEQTKMLLLLRDFFEIDSYSYTNSDGGTQKQQLSFNLWTICLK
ncbi:hypothetical protein PR048_001052 [Dryococelus australis]|uniref:Transposable element P transposase n=1 Tax=Dryococelus australis TaxID=614101 RepID=A0ABQ9IGB5_9NEOP|nr:hypothetical protein PR048_001052 [Dryococelus australis]